MTLGNIGYRLHQSMLHESILADMEACIAESATCASPHGIRHLFSRAPGLGDLVRKHVIDPLTSPDYRPVRTVYFDKTERTNWNVAWHQDTTISVCAAELPGDYCNVRQRDGYCSVEPPIRFLASMVTLRIHLDAADRFNGCLRVVPGSHRNGRIPSNHILDRVKEGPVVDLEVCRGDVLVMHPLLFHSSRKAQSPRHRRVIHVECCNAPLPHGVEWAEGLA